jgi:hypothetical protein
VEEAGGLAGSYEEIDVGRRFFWRATCSFALTESEIIPESGQRLIAQEERVDVRVSHPLSDLVASVFSLERIGHS